MASNHVLKEAGADSSKPERMVEDLMQTKGLKKDSDVVELYLSERDLTATPDLKRFKNLQILWLNGNKICKLTGFKTSCCLTELYLQNNALKGLEGYLQSLICLQILMLQSNQLYKLSNILFEFRKMKNLQVLNLFGNPVAQEPNYRDYTIFKIPSLEVLDRQAIIRADRQRVMEIYDEQQLKLKENVAFGIGVTTLRNACYPVTREAPLPNFLCGQREECLDQPNSIEEEELDEQKDGNRTTNQQTSAVKQGPQPKDKEQPTEHRRSLNQFSAFGWPDVMKVRQQGDGRPSDKKRKPVKYVCQFR